MSTPIALPQFTVQQYIEDAVTPDSSTPGAPVDVEPLNILVKFTPSVREIQVPSGTPPFTAYLDTIQGRVDTDGVLKGINSNPVYYKSGSTINPVPTVSGAGFPVHAVWTGGSDPGYWIDDEGNRVDNPAGTPVYGVRLVQSAAMFGLTDPLTYRVDYSRGPVPIKSFRFTAPATDSVIDLSSVTRIEL